MIISIIVIILISLFTFYQSFSLGLFGDDWLAFFRHAQHLGPKSSGEWNYLTYYLNPYGPQDILMGLLQKIIDYQSTYYYLLSYILRLLAAFSFYPLIFYLTKNKLSGFFAVLFFSITATGLDTTNWVFNMPSYVTVALFNFCLFFFIKQREKGEIKLLLLAAIFYYFAYITTPIRMHGSLLFLFLLEIFWVVQERKSSVSRKAAIRFLVMLGAFLIVRFAGHSQGPPQEPSERFFLGIKAMSEMLSQGRFDFVFYPVIMFGSAIIPDFILPSIQVISKSKLLVTNLIPSFLAFLIFSFTINRYISATKMNLFKYMILGIIGWIIVVVIIFHVNLRFLNDGRFISLLLIGGFSIILVSLLIIKYFKEKNISTALFLGLSWSICSFLFAWWWVPASIFPTTYRYLIVTAMGITVIIATISSLGKNKASQKYLFAIFCLIIFLHVISTRIYFNFVLSSHGQEIDNKIWSSIPYVDKIGKTKDPIIFYFEGDGTNGGILHDVITFGFPPHMALLYNIREECGCIPIPMSDLKEVISAVTDGKSMRAYGYPEKPVSIEGIYAFHLQGKDNLVNLTDQLREKLAQIKLQ